ncbi:hypothetical protein MASR2M79_25360 [Aminivibrio sp.]
MRRRGKKVKIVFSGDLSPQATVMERNPAVISDADYVMESTYGDRLHKTNEREPGGIPGGPEKSAEVGAKVFLTASSWTGPSGSSAGCPCFRTREFWTAVSPSASALHGSEGHGDLPDHLNLFSSEIQQYVSEGNDPFAPENLKYVTSVEESRP